MKVVVYRCDNPECGTIVEQKNMNVPDNWVQAGYQSAGVLHHFTPVHDFCSHDCMDAVYNKVVKKEAT